MTQIQRRKLLKAVANPRMFGFASADEARAFYGSPVTEGPAGRVTTVRPFRCPRCGDTRNTTVAGHCDDCES